jgi:hypothetical protein
MGSRVNVLLAAFLAGGLLISACNLACAQSPDVSEKAAPKPSDGGALTIGPPTTADDFLARTRIGRDTWLALITKAAAANNLPSDFLARLIAQESGFDPSSVSKAGAWGIAQFMPATAATVGLRDPFDPVEAIAAAAQHLRDLRASFGNLGLAAAAYNAGARRVTAWLSRQGSLPQETLNYVRVVTGRDVSDWAPERSGSSGSQAALLTPVRSPALAQPIQTNKRSPSSSTTALCQAVNSASSTCIVRQRY